MPDDSIMNEFTKHARLIAKAEQDARDAKTLAVVSLMISVAFALFCLAAFGAFS